MSANQYQPKAFRAQRATAFYSIRCRHLTDGDYYSINTGEVPKEPHQAICYHLNELRTSLNELTHQASRILHFASIVNSLRNQFKFDI